jgi:bacterioferritin (cytochrome b1)
MAKGNLDELKSILNRALTLEYTLIIHYPRLAAMIPDEATRKLASELGSASIKHADIVANAIIRLGGKPDWSFEPFPEKVDLVSIFQTQLGKEKTALELHRQSAYLVADSALREKFEDIAKEEESHIKMVQDILERLRK